MPTYDVPVTIRAVLHVVASNREDAAIQAQDVLGSEADSVLGGEDFDFLDIAVSYRRIRKTGND